MVAGPGADPAELAATWEKGAARPADEHSAESLPSHTRLRVAPDTDEWISFQPGNATVEFLDGMRVPPSGAGAQQRG